MSLYLNEKGTVLLYVFSTLCGLGRGDEEQAACSSITLRCTPVVTDVLEGNRCGFGAHPCDGLI